MTKKSNKTSPASPASGKRDQVTQNNSLAEVKKVTLEIQYEEFLGERIPYVSYEGKKRYPVNTVGRILGYDEKNEYRLYRANKSFLEQFTISLYLRGNLKITSVPCIDSQGLLIMTGRAPLKNMPEERRATVIKIVQFMAESADLRLKGELVPTLSPVLLSNMVQDRITTCKQVSAAVGCDLSTLISMELAQVEEDTQQTISYRNALPLQNPIRKAAVFTETELGKPFNVTGRKIQMILKDKGYLQSIGGRLDFTYTGLLFGDWRPGIEFKGRMRTMARMRRFWNQDIVPKLEEHFYYIQKAKEGLFLGELQVIS